MGGAAPSKIPDHEEEATSSPSKHTSQQEGDAPSKHNSHQEADNFDAKLRSEDLQTIAFGDLSRTDKYREYPEIKKSKSSTLEWNDSTKLEASEDKPPSPIKSRIDAKQKPAPPTKPRPPPNRPQSITASQPKVATKGLKSEWDTSSLIRESKTPSQTDSRRYMYDTNSSRISATPTSLEHKENQTSLSQGGSRIISKIQQCVDGSSSDSDDNDSSTVYDWTLTQTQAPLTHPDIKMTQPSIRVESYSRDTLPPKQLIRTVSDRDDEFIADFRNSEAVSNDFVKPEIVPMLNIPEGPIIMTSESKYVPTVNPPLRVVLPPRGIQKSGPSTMTAGGRGPLPVRGPPVIRTNIPMTSANRPTVTPSPNHYLISPLNRPPQEHHQVKETKDVKRNRAQIPSTLTHAKPTTGDWLKKRYIVNNYILLDLLGTGSYGEVKLCKDRTTDKLYAMKIFSKEMLKKRKGGNTSETYFEDIKREIAIMKKLSHPNVLKLFEVLDDPNVNKMYLVLEYMKRGDLIKFLKSRESTDEKETKDSTKRKNSEKLVTLSDAELKVIFTQVVSGVKYLHYQNIIHGDIKPQNILVGDDNLVKIADFGISKMLENGSAQKLVDAGGTPAFMAPELCSSSEAFSGQLADIWAIGATMFMLRFGHPPFVASNVLALYNKIVNDPLEFPPVAIDPGLRNLLVNMLEKDPKLRYNMDQITSHPWLRFAPRPVASPFVHHPESSIKSDKQVLQLSDQYFNEEAEAMKCPKKIVDKEEIYRSIGYGVEQKHQSEDGDSGDEKAEELLIKKDDEEEEDIMATNWAADVFEQVDDADLDSDDDDDDGNSIDEESPQKPHSSSFKSESKATDMDESEQDRRSKEFKQKLIAKSSAANFHSFGPSQNRSRPGRVDSVDDGTDDELESVQQSRLGHRESLELGDPVEELSMNDFEEMMDTLAMRPTSKVSQLPLPTNSPFSLENLTISSHSINVRSGLGGVSYSDQGCRRSQEDRAVLLLNFEQEGQLAAESGHYEQLLNLSVAAVFDGHSGEACASYLAKNFVRSMVLNQHFYSTKTLKQSMLETCLEIDAQVCKELKSMNDSSGSTGVIVAYDGRSRRLTVANVGDSKCILCRNGSAVSIHRTHRVGDHDDEIIRIKSAGGSVVNKRVNGVLAISRAFGDTAFKDEHRYESSLVISTPEVYSEIVTPMTEFCVIASDGLWDVMEPQAVVNYIRDRINGKSSVDAIVQDLVNEAIEIDKISPTFCGLPTIDSMSNLQSVKTFLPVRDLLKNQTENFLGNSSAIQISHKKVLLSKEMQNDTGVYIPPHLRNRGGDERDRRDYSRDNYSAQRNDSRSGSHYNSSGPSGGGYETNSRWKLGNDSGGRSGGGWGSGGYGGGSGYGGGYGGGSSYGSGGGYGYGPRPNSLGFFGDERPNRRLENELFHSGEGQSAGINFDKYDDIPVEVSDGCPEHINEFSIESVGEALYRNVVLSGYVKPTPVQKYSIPIGLAGGDMMACAQTGSGKTAGFLFPVITSMLKHGALQPPGGASHRSMYPTALVLAPTRELASQIYDEALKFCYCTGIRPVVVYGGANISNQMRDLERGADLLVATPGRLVDLIERGRIKLDIIQFLVLDEADRMLDMGFEPQIRRIVEQEGMPTERQTFMFSATFPTEIQRLAADFMKDYIFLAVGRVGAASKDVVQTIEWVEQDDKVNFTIDFLKRAPEGLLLIFVETKRGADYLEECLCRNSFPASSIHGDKSQREREDALRLFKSGRTPILVATDVASRGLDIPNVTQVINFDLPSHIDDYVHRIGRTGRVGNVGSALSLMNERNRNIAKDLMELFIENEQYCPPWLERMCMPQGYSGQRGGRGRGGRGSKFGARDVRKDRGPSGSGGGSGGRGWSGSSQGGYSSGGHSGSSRYPDARSGYSDNSAW